MNNVFTNRAMKIEETQSTPDPMRYGDFVFEALLLKYSTPKEVSIKTTNKPKHNRPIFQPNNKPAAKPNFTSPPPIHLPDEI